MSDDKKIDYVTNASFSVHRLLGKVPEFQKKCGFWIINGSVSVCTSPDGYANCMPRRFEFYSLSHLHHGGGKLWLDGSGEIDLEPGCWVLIAPGDLHRYGGAENKPYIEDSICFCGPYADRLRNAGVIRSGCTRAGNVRKLMPVIELAQDPSNDAQINANTMLQSLLVELYNERRRQVQPSDIERLIEELKRHPEQWWSVQELADYCNLSTDQLRRNFFRHTGMMPKNYIEALKLRQAAQLLTSSARSISEVATRFGYRDPYHFSRRFKIQTGMSPKSYRKMYALQH